MHTIQKEKKTKNLEHLTEIYTTLYW